VGILELIREPSIDEGIIINNLLLIIKHVRHLYSSKGLILILVIISVINRTIIRLNPDELNRIVDRIKPCDSNPKSGDIL